MKLKIKSSAKTRRRYLLLEADSKKVVEETIIEYVGILGWARASPLFISTFQKIILSIDRRELSNIRAAFEVSKNKITIKKVSGTLEGLGIKNKS